MPRRRNDFFTPEAQAAREKETAAHLASLPWIDLERAYPRPGASVMVRLSDGRVTQADLLKRGGWSFRPWDKPGEPVAWYEGSPAHSTEGASAYRPVPLVKLMAF